MKETNGVRAASNLRGGVLAGNHNQSGVTVASKVRAGALAPNHNQPAGLKAASKVRCGSLGGNHNPGGRSDRVPDSRGSAGRKP